MAGFAIPIWQLVRDQFDSAISGVRRIELQFFLIAYIVLVANFFLGRLIRLFTHSENLDPYTPLRIVAFAIVIAYGITSRGILNVRAALRLALAYVLLGAYTALLFVGVWYGAGSFLVSLGVRSELGQALAAGVAVTLLVNATGTPLRRVALKILPAQDVDFERTVVAVSKVVQQVAELEELIPDFNAVLRQAVGAPRVWVLLADEEGYHELLPDGNPGPGMARDDLAADELLKMPDLALEELARRAPGPRREQLLARLEELEADLVLPVHYQGALTAMVFLGARASGRVYGIKGRRTLRLIAEQFGVAIANAKLYTEARQSQAYNQFLVEHLSCGVAATDPKGRLTVVNPAARRLLRLDGAEAAARLELPPGVAPLLPRALREGAMAEGQPLVLRPGARDQTVLRVDCLPFSSARGRLLGALLVLNDHTAIENLQRQVRQADRLASIGTLAAGMAHEIKNPLTAIKTFIQLLPARYLDDEFRRDFTGLAINEIGRIERIVNQLFAFARPAPMQIGEVALHAVVDEVARLLRPQAARARITVRQTRLLGADTITGDKDRLQQVVLNLLLNAIQASRERGEVEIVTEMEPDLPGKEPLLRLDVRDRGCGIPAEELPHIFDPFFTTKTEGTGLGLAVSYNIIAEHQGRLAVRSEPGEGTCFSVYLPAPRPAAPEPPAPEPAPPLSNHAPA